MNYSPRANSLIMPTMIQEDSQEIDNNSSSNDNQENQKRDPNTKTLDLNDLDKALKEEELKPIPYDYRVDAPQGDVSPEDTNPENYVGN